MVRLTPPRRAKSMQQRVTYCFDNAHIFFGLHKYKDDYWLREKLNF